MRLLNDNELGLGTLQGEGTPISSETRSVNFSPLAKPPTRGMEFSWAREENSVHVNESLVFSRNELFS